MNCKLGAISLIDQIKSTMEDIDDAHFNAGLDIYNGSTLGKHFRHIYDFFHCLTCQCINGHVDYSTRERDERLENDKNYAVNMFSELQQKLSQLDENLTLHVNADFLVGEGQRPKVLTSVGRELMYAYDHAIHHLAIVKIGLKDLYPTRQINEQLGVAASTILHQKKLV